MSEKEKSKYLISIAIGPVQDFIASSRRTRDLWFGSWLLSELSKVVAKHIGKENLIFPAISDAKDLEADSPFNVVNKILALIEKPSQDFDKHLRCAINRRLETIYKATFDELEKNLNKDKSLFYRTNASPG